MKIKRFMTAAGMGLFLTLTGCAEWWDFPGSSQYDDGLVFSSDGSLLAPKAGPNPKVWDTKTRRILWETGHATRSRIDSVAFSPDGRMLASGDLDGNVKLRGARAGELFWAGKHDGRVYALAFSPDGRTLASGVGRCGAGNVLIKLWDAETGKVLHQLISARRIDVDDVHEIVFSPDGGALVSRGHVDRTIKLWDTRNGGLLQTFSGHSDYVASVAFSPDGKVLASGSFDTTVKLWDVRTGSLIRTLRGHGDKVRLVVFSPDGRTLVSKSDDASIHVWDAETGALSRTLTRALPGYKYRVSSVAFSPDGTMLASGSEEDTTVKLWDVGTGRLLRKIKPVHPLQFLVAPAAKKLFGLEIDGHAYGIDSVVFSPDGQTLASSSVDPEVKLWNVETLLLQASE